MEGPPEWCSGLRLLEILSSSSGSVAAGRDRETHGAAYNWPSVGRVSGGGLAGTDVLVPSRTSDSCGGRAQCTLTQSPGAQCFLRHIGAAGFRVKRALCQEAVRFGWVVFRRTHFSRPSPLQSPYWSCSVGTRLTTNWIPRNWGEKKG